MLSLYNQDFKPMQKVSNTKMPNVNETAKYTSPMITRTEYNDYYKPFKV